MEEEIKTKIRVRPGPKVRHNPENAERMIRFRFSDGEYERITAAMPRDSRERGELLLAIVGAAEVGGEVKLTLQDGKIAVVEA